MSRILMSDAKRFSINYTINPWMVNQIGQVESGRAHSQWETLKNTLETLTHVEIIPSHENLPDLVFTANAATVKGNKCVLSHFKNIERQGEEPIFYNWFEKNNFQITTMPDSVFFEGAGDALFSINEEMLWIGHGFRSDSQSADILETELDTPVTTLKLINPHFYHLDTCFCPLDLGHVMYYPAAFDNQANKKIETYYPTHLRITVNESDARLFSCNAVCVNRSEHPEYQHTIILNDCSKKLEIQLNLAGYQVIKTPMSEFLKSGGSTKCLTLKLPSNTTPP
jgi:N-dimethylarginine dimethylaminohydrolase